MSTSHKDLDFSILQNLLLLKIKYFGVSKVRVKHSSWYTSFIYYSLLESSHRNTNRYILSEKGKMYLRYKLRKFFAFWIPTVIAIIALFGGYDVTPIQY